MSSADNMSLPDRVRAYARLAALAGASLGLVVLCNGGGRRAPVTVEYQSIFRGLSSLRRAGPGGRVAAGQ